MQKIVVCHNPHDEYTAEIVATAMVRSFSAAQIARTSQSARHGVDGGAVLINPGDDRCALVGRLLSSGGKVLLSGRLGPRLAEQIGLDVDGRCAMREVMAAPRVNAAVHHNESPAAVIYDDRHELSRRSPLPVRPLCRFDFANEWNNFSFGRIQAAGGPWSIAVSAEAAGAYPIAWACEQRGGRASVYAGLFETENGAALWFNRPVGPADSLEWTIVEAFFGDYRADDLPCFPYLSEIPADYGSAATMRIDCDEAVGSARPLFELYRDHGLPFSLAVATGLPMDAVDWKLARDVIAAGGTVASHSADHLPNWGGDIESAYRQGLGSKRWLEQHLPQAAPVRYAVSPFHQTPAFAVRALSKAGYRGVVGGSIACWPEAVLGRAGQFPFVTRRFVALTSQCMLHGDCVRRYGNSIDSYRQCFEQHFAAGSVFGYLDHPFSARYQYGWDSEAQRIDAHNTLIGFIQSHPPVWWAGTTQVLSFLYRRNCCRLAVSRDGELHVASPAGALGPPIAVHWKGCRKAA